MKQIIFNSSMPRACSTLLQNIFNQNPDICGTSTDGLLELLTGARERFTNADEFKADLDRDKVLKTWLGFCEGGIDGYVNNLTDKPCVVLKGRGWKAASGWLEKIYNAKPDIIICVRDLKSIVASFEKLYRKNPHKISQWYIEHEIRGTTIEKRVDMYLNNPPLGLDIDRVKDVIDINAKDGNVHFVRAEDLTSQPVLIMNELYGRIFGGEYTFEHDFTNVENSTLENDVVHGLDEELHVTRTKIEPLKDDSEEILGKAVCDYIDTQYKWYQEYFKYV